MIIKIISTLLILLTVYFNVKHGWAGVTMNQKSDGVDLLAQWGISKPVFFVISSLTLAGSILILFPATFFVGNILNALIILVIMAFQLKSDSLKAAAIEIPFLLMPLIII